MNRGTDSTSDNAATIGTKRIALDLNADSFRVTSLSLNGGRLSLTIEAEVSDSAVRPALPGDEPTLTIDLGAKTVGGEIPAPGTAAKKPTRLLKVAPVDIGPNSAASVPVPGLDFGLAENEEEVAGPAVVQSGGSEALRPVDAPPPTRKSDRFSIETQAKSITLGPVADTDANATAVAFAPAPSPLSLEPEPPRPRPSQRVATQPKSISLGDDIPLTLQPETSVSSPPPAASAPSITLGDDTGLSLGAIEPGADATTPTLEPINPAEVTSAPGVSISFGDEPVEPALELNGDWSAAPEAPKPGPPPGGAKEITLGGVIPEPDSPEFDMILDKPLKPLTQVESPEPMMETWDPSSLSIEEQPEPIIAAESSTVGGARHGEPQPGISFGDAEPAPMPGLALSPEPTPPSFEAPQPAAPALDIGLAPAPEPLSLEPPTPTPAPVPLSLEPQAPAAPSLDLTPTPAPAPLSIEPLTPVPEPAPLSLEAQTPAAPALDIGLAPAPAPLSLEPQTPAAPSLDLAQPPAPLSIEPEVPAAGPAPLSLDAHTPAAPSLDLTPTPASLSPEPEASAPGPAPLSLDIPAPAPELAPALAPLSIEPLAPAAEPAPLTLEPPTPAALSLDLAPSPTPAPLSIEPPVPAPGPAPLSLEPEAPAAPAAPALGVAPAPSPEPPAVNAAAPSPMPMEPPASSPAAPAAARQEPSSTQTGGGGKPEAGGTTVLIRYTCPKCKTQGMQAVDKVGTVVNCSNCGKAMRLVMKK